MSRIGNQNMDSRTLVLPNVYEFNRRGLPPELPKRDLDSWRDVGNVLTDLALFWSGEDKLIVSPRPIDSGFVQYVRDHVGFQRLLVQSPRPPRRCESGLSRAVLADPELLQRVVEYVRGGESTTLLTWGITEDVYLFLDALTSQGASVKAPDVPPRHSYWNVIYLDSKAGFRHRCTEIGASDQRIAMPEGFICHSLADVVEFVRYFYRRGSGCVLKPNRGLGGIGIIMLELEWAKHPDELLLKHIENQAAKNPYFFTHGPIIVERKIQARPMRVDSLTTIGSVFMNALIGSDGQIEVLGGGCELRDNNNHYVGAQMGKGSVIESVASTVEPVMWAICRAVASYGHRGHVGVDFLLDDEGNPVILELNPRRCSESHVYDLARRFFGIQWRSTCYALTRLPLSVMLDAEPDIGSVLEAFDAVSRQVSSAGMLVIPTCVSWLHLGNHGIGYVIFGPDKETVDHGETVLLNELACRGIHRKHR